MVALPRDKNRVVVIAGVSSINLKTPIAIAVNPTTNAVKVEVV